MKITKLFLTLFVFFFTFTLNSNSSTFVNWKNDFKKIAIKQGISELTFDKAMANVKFLPKVIEYDRYQPEFYEDTNTYVSKRTSQKKLKKGLIFYNNNKNLINKNKGITVITPPKNKNTILTGCVVVKLLKPDL